MQGEGETAAEPSRVPEDCLDYEPSEAPRDEGMEAVDDDGPLFPELFQVDPEDGEGGLKVVSHRVRSKQPEAGESPEGQNKGFSHDKVRGRNHTLFIGAPMRSKTGREVLLHVQAAINKLEAYGFPVQRYHSDRAKELRSASLCWLG